jgi:N-acetylglucosaminyldiphosphoundecaprenol N-acetyl-beta-D-mannosaminyltransferase
MLEKRNIVGAEITNASFSQILEDILQRAQARNSSYVCLSNVHMVVEAYQNAAFRPVLSGAALAAPDGKPLSIAMNLLYKTQQARVAGPDLMVDILERAQTEGLTVYFYGSTPEILDALEGKLKQDFPSLRFVGRYSPPFRVLSDAEDQIITSNIVNSGAQIVFVGLGCPKQEMWMSAHQGRIPAVMLGVGAAFPFYTGHLKRCPKWMQHCCLEWLYRLAMEPRRLFKRYFITNLLFLFLLARQLLQQKQLLRF